MKQNEILNLNWKKKNVFFKQKYEQKAQNFKVCDNVVHKQEKYEFKRFWSACFMLLLII